MRSRLRFAIALALAAVLGAYLLFASLGGALEEYSGPAELREGVTYRLNGLVGPDAPANAAEQALSAQGLSFTVVDKEEPTRSVRVLYRGAVHDTYTQGREVVLTGELRKGVFHAETGSMIMLCPSKFSDRPEDHQTPVT